MRCPTLCGGGGRTGSVVCRCVTVCKPKSMRRASLTNSLADHQARRSNARIVRWSDGSSSLQIGSEFWEVDNSAAQHRAAPFGGSGTQVDDKASPSQTSQSNGSAKSNPKGVSLLLANDRLNQVAVGQSLVAGELSLVPSGPEAIKRQQRVQLAIDGTVRKAGIKTWDDAAGADPELAQQERERVRRKNRGGPRTQPAWDQRVPASRAGGGGGGSGGSRTRSAGGGGGGSRRARQASFDSDDMDEDPIGTSRGGGGGGGSGYQADGFVVSGSAWTTGRCALTHPSVGLGRGRRRRHP